MTVEAEEFLRRFLLHVLPRGFVRIRSFGFLANRRRAKLLSHCQQLLGSERESGETCILRGFLKGFSSVRTRLALLVAGVRPVKPQM
jgi:hypothetical protein